MSTLRIRFLGVLAALIAIILVSRLFSISFLQHDLYVRQANKQQSIVRDVLPRRGDILAQDLADGHSAVIAKSMERFAVSATPKDVKRKEQYAHLLAGLTGANEQDLLVALKESGEYMAPLKHGLTEDDVTNLAKQINDLEKSFDPTFATINVNFDPSQGDVIYYLGGVYFVREYQRVYPEGPLLGQVLGFVNDDGQGRYGFEQHYDKDLEGYTGRLLLQQDSLGTLLQQKQGIQGQNGTSYELSIDRNIQFQVEQALAQEVKDSEAKSGSVIIMNPKTGEIIAMANTPSYDPSAFRDVKTSDAYLFDNPTISYLWEPGSIFKDLVMGAALDTGVVTPDTQSDFPESVTVDGHVIETALRKAYGVENMTDILKNSDNVAMVWVANKLGNDKMYNYLQKFGFGQPTNIDLQNEAVGKVLPESQWRNINRATIAFGQGISVTPIQMVTAYSAIANNGRLVQPRVVHAIITPDGKRTEVPTIEGERVLKPETAKTLRDMMVATVLFAHNRAGTPGYKVGGKTGTAQIPDPVNGGYIADAYNHSFVGMAPSDDPKYVMLIKIDQPNTQKVGLFAESTAVPLFGKLSTFLLNYYQIPPTNR